MLTLVAFIWFFSSVHFHMSPQTECMKRGIVTSVAFVWLFSTVRFIMSPQNACLRRGIFTLLAFVWFFSTVRFYMCPQNVCLSRGIVGRIGCICLTSLQCVFSNVSSNGLHEKMHNHTSCNCLIFPFVHWQLFHWCSSAWNDQAQEFVQSPQVGKLCHQNQDLLVRPGYNFAQLFRDIPEAIAHLIPKSDN